MLKNLYVLVIDRKLIACDAYMQCLCICNINAYVYVYAMSISMYTQCQCVYAISMSILGDKSLISLIRSQ